MRPEQGPGAGTDHSATPHWLPKPLGGGSFDGQVAPRLWLRAAVGVTPGSGWGGGVSVWGLLRALPAGCHHPALPAAPRGQIGGHLLQGPEQVALPTNHLLSEKAHTGGREGRHTRFLTQCSAAPTLTGAHAPGAVPGRAAVSWARWWHRLLRASLRPHHPGLGLLLPSRTSWEPDAPAGTRSFPADTEGRRVGAAGVRGARSLGLPRASPGSPGAGPGTTALGVPWGGC